MMESVETKVSNSNLNVDEEVLYLTSGHLNFELFATSAVRIRFSFGQQGFKLPLPE